MILGIGVDLIEVDRIRRAILKFGDRFRYRVCTFNENEMADSLISNNINSIQTKFHAFFAKRFAAKEAFAKALGYGIGKKVRFHDIEVLNDKFGKPYIRYRPAGDADWINKYKIHLSISDTKEYATAYVIIEKV